MTFKEGMAVAEIHYNAEEVMREGETIRKGVMENEAYEVMENPLTGEFIVRVGNHIMDKSELAELGGKV